MNTNKPGKVRRGKPLPPPSHDAPLYARKVRELLTYYNVTVSSDPFARRIGTNRGTLRRWALGQQEPDRQAKLAIQAELEIPLAWWEDEQAVLSLSTDFLPVPDRRIASTDRRKTARTTGTPLPPQEQEQIRSLQVLRDRLVNAITTAVDEELTSRLPKGEKENMKT